MAWFIVYYIKTYVLQEDRFNHIEHAMLCFNLHFNEKPIRRPSLKEVYNLIIHIIHTCLRMLRGLCQIITCPTSRKLLFQIDKYDYGDNKCSLGYSVLIIFQITEIA